MALRHYANAPATALSAPCTAGATTISVDSASAFPVSTPYIVILDRGEASEEVVLVTNAAGNTLTVTRGYDSTTAFSHGQGASVEHGISAIDPREANEHINAIDGVHGVSGDVVGTTDTQTLTNKDMTSGTNSFPPTLVTLTGAQTLTNKTFDDSSPSVFLPPGAMTMFAGATAPTGWLICDGAAVSRTTHAALFAAIGTTFGAGDGSTTFNLPNLTDKLPMGGGTLGATGGSATATLSIVNMPSHTHAVGTLATQSDGSHSHGAGSLTYSNRDGTGGAGGAARGSATEVGNPNVFGSTAAGGAHTHDITGATASSGSGTAFSILPPHIRLNYIIKT